MKPDSPAAWCRSRYWQWRLPLILYLAYTAARGYTQPMEWSWWSGITLAVHEAGHIIFSPFGTVLEAAGGSITQIAAPVLVIWLFRKQGEWFGMTVGGMWLASSLANLATYIGDARAQELELVGFTDQPQHDWNFILGHFHALSSDTAIAGVVRAIGVMVLIASTLFALWLCWIMFRTTGRSRGGTEVSSGGDS